MKRQATDFTPHLDRYVFAMHHVQRRKTMDAGGKTGYGSDIMSYVAGPITLVDREEIHLRKSRHETIQADFEKEFPEGEWEAIVAFEIIEHLEDPEFFVRNIAEHLTEGGKLVFSVPHMKEEIDHKVLFDKRKITDLISKYLTIEEFYVQDKYGISGESFTKYPLTYVGVARK